MSFATVILGIIHFMLGLRALFLGWFLGLRNPFSFIYRKPSLAAMRTDSHTVGKLPTHIGILIVEPDISYADIANIIIWAMAMGISYISIYDRQGILKRNKSSLQLALDEQKSTLQDGDCMLPNVHIHHSKRDYKSKDISSHTEVEIFLLSMEDGRQDLVKTARQLSRAVTNKEFRAADITPSNVDAILKERHGFPDPDLLLRFGKLESLMGFPPWQIRLTEIIGSPTHHNLTYSAFYELLVMFSATEQRLGK